MDLKRYKKTRYQNIYKSIKKQNYVVAIPGTHSTISIEEKGNKIFDIEQAIRLRDNKKIKITKKSQLSNNATFKEVWTKYYKWCEDNLSYNTIRKKKILYNAFLYQFDDMKLSSIKNEEFTRIIEFICVNKEFLKRD